MKRTAEIKTQPKYETQIIFIHPRALLFVPDAEQGAGE
jgi:hypothetical protein